jgi:hypothetical protein
MDEEIRDDQAPDGTTAFSIALGKGNIEIVKQLLQFKITQKSEMDALYQAAEKTKAKEKVKAMFDEAEKAKGKDEMVALHQAAEKAKREMENSCKELASDPTQTINTE